MSNKKGKISALLFLVAWCSGLAQAQGTPPRGVGVAAPRRVALVMGNGNYKSNGQLANPPNDAADVGAALTAAGFTLTGGAVQTDLPYARMKQLVAKFGEELTACRRQGACVGVFFYAGHGIQANGRNFLIPVDATLQRENLLEFEAVDVNYVLAQMEADNDQASQLNIVILDACRNNPFKRSWRDTRQGLAQINSPSGTLLAYATRPDGVAADGAGRNSPYTAALKEKLREKGLEVKELFNQVGVAVQKETKYQQTPWQSSSPLPERFCFQGCAGDEGPRPSGRGQEVIEDEFWDSVKGSRDPSDFQDYLDAYPQGRYASLAKSKKRQLESKPAPPPTPQPTPARPVTGQTDTETLPGGVAWQMVYVAGGTFQMGSPKSEKDRGDDETQHQVTISQPYYIGKYEVTQGQWQAVMGGLPPGMADLDNKFKGDNLPVVRVSWDEAQEFCAKLSQMTGRKYRLPTEAEWEMAARATTTGPFAFGNSLSSKQANFDGNYPYGGAAKGPYLERPAAVGSYAANAWGLHDMHGNVWEWCEDWYGAYSSGAVTDPRGPGTGSIRVERGGSWNGTAVNARSAYRGYGAPGLRYFNLGFRLARTPV